VFKERSQKRWRVSKFDVGGRGAWKNVRRRKFVNRECILSGEAA
jgi:hypothetical protein